MNLAGQDATPVTGLHRDGKVRRNADPAPPRRPVQPAVAQAAQTVDTPSELQKPKAEKALTRVNFQPPRQRLIDQMAVPQDPNEEAAIAAPLATLDLLGVLRLGDAAQTVNANSRKILYEYGGEGLFLLTGNQPLALAKARQLLPGTLPPTGPVAG